MSASNMMRSGPLACFCALLLVIASVHADDGSGMPNGQGPAGGMQGMGASQPSFPGGSFSGMQGPGGFQNFMQPGMNQFRPGMSQFGQSGFPGQSNFPGNGGFNGQDQFSGQMGNGLNGMQMKQVQQIIMQALQSPMVQQQLMQSFRQQCPCNGANGAYMGGQGVGFQPNQQFGGQNGLSMQRGLMPSQGGQVSPQ